MVWGRRLLRVCAALALLLVAVAPAQADGAGHGDVLTATPAWSPVDATAGAFNDTTFLIGSVELLNLQTVHLCAYTVADKDGVVSGVRVIAVKTTFGNDTVAAATDDVFLSVEDAAFVYTPWNWGYFLRLYVRLPSIGALSLELDSGAPGQLLYEERGWPLSSRVLARNGHGLVSAWAATMDGKPVRGVEGLYGTRGTGYCESHLPADPQHHLPS